MIPSLPSVIEVDGGNHQCKASNTEPGACVPLWMPLKWILLEQRPEQETERSHQWLQKNLKKKQYWKRPESRKQSMCKIQFEYLSKSVQSLSNNEKRWKRLAWDTFFETSWIKVRAI